MLYPIISYEDGTEVTASRPDENGRVTVYTEKFDVEKDSFVFAEILIPNVELKSFDGYSEGELEFLLKQYAEIQDDIIGYVLERERNSA